MGYSTYACTGLFFCCSARVGSAGIKSLHHHLAVPIPGYVPTNHLSITSPSLTLKFVSTMMWMLVSSPFLPLCVPTPRTPPSTSTHHQQQRRPVVAATTAAAGRAQHHQHHGNRSPRRDGRVHKHRAQENRNVRRLVYFLAESQFTQKLQVLCTSVAIGLPQSSGSSNAPPDGLSKLDCSTTRR